MVDRFEPNAEIKSEVSLINNPVKIISITKSLTKKEKKRTILIYSLSSLFNDIGANMIYPLWPFFVTEILGINRIFLGIIDGIGDFLISFSKAFSGWLSDVIHKRKRFIWIGYLLPFIARLGYAFSSIWTHLLLFKSIDRFGKIRDPPRDAVISEVIPKNERGKAFGTMELFDKLGGVFGLIILIFLLIFYSSINYVWLFLSASVFSLISVIIIYFFMDDYFKKNKSNQHFDEDLTKGIKANLKNSRFIFLLFIASLISLATFSFSFIFLLVKPILSNVIFLGLDFNKLSSLIVISAIGFLIYNLSASFSSVYFGRIADKVGRKQSIILTNFIYLFCLAFLFLNLSLNNFYLKIFLLIFSFFLYGLYIGALNTTLITYVSDLADKKYKATGIGIYYFVFGIFSLFASLIAGYLSTVYSNVMMINFSFICIFLSIFLLVFNMND